ncbi:hypothetical protein GobsT_52220 [Gemmata obscuriglobus]|nr:hypothetical protein [Gemmata obscuriglobus]QEG30417.1 hypothetical protein GobsT_52220 [Gemmata obscuriglobus]VTS09741.1 unnamed protein product [Gemmata obscuriglobus UQM 2246]
MTSTRFLLTGFVVALGTGPVVAQPRTAGFGDYSSLVPSVRPVAAAEPEVPPPAPPVRTPAGVTSLQQMQAPPGAGPAGWLDGEPAATQPAYPPGSYPSPYYVDGPGCCGPLGRDGRIGYELYSFTGLNFTIGNGLPDRLNAVGWTVGGGVRTLFFDATHTAAWTIDLGGSYTYNRGQGAQSPTNLFLRTPAADPSPNDGVTELQPQPDRLVLSGIRGIRRSSFNYAIGRDVWLLGNGSTGGQNGTNWRVGGWIGGRYGTSSVDVNPLTEVDGYARRQNVFHGIFTGVHTTFDIPVGAWIWTNGVRVEYGHDWTNLVPPIQGNIHNINIQFTTGIRY